MATFSVLSFAVASGKVGYVYLAAGTLQDWGITVKAARDGSELVGFAQELISTLKPDIVVSENTGRGCRKGAHTKRLIQSLAELASHNYVLDVSVGRPRNFPSKYEEAEALAEQHPEMLGYLPANKRRIFDFEPRCMVLFEALALGKVVMDGSPADLAALMG